MSKLFLDGIFKKNDSPSGVHIYMPNSSKKTGENTALNLYGLMVGDVSFQAQNKWGTILHDLSNLADFSSLAGQESMFSWVNASTMCWKGTNPLTIGIEFYLINYQKGLGLESQLKRLIKLASLYKNQAAGSLGSNFKVLVHGGYAADILKSNSSLWSMELKSVMGLQNDSNLNGPESIDKKLYDSNGNALGSLTLRFGHKSTIRNVLLSKIDVTESNVEVIDQAGGNIKPLYYRVSAQFTGVRPLLSTDVDHMFNY